MTAIALTGLFLFGIVLIVIGLICLFKGFWTGFPLAAIGAGISYVTGNSLYHGAIKYLIPF